MRGLMIAVLVVALMASAGWWLTRPADEADAQRARGAATVIVAPVQLRPVSDAIQALGTAKAVDSVVMAPTIAERVTAIEFADGAAVKQGDVLVRLDDAAERAELAAAQARQVEKQRALDRVRRLIEQGTISDAELDAAQASLETAAADVRVLQAAIADRVLTAPFAGRTGLRQISIGAYVEAGDAITTIDDTSMLHVDFTVPAAQMAGLRAGLPVRARHAAYPDFSFAGELSAVATRVDTATRAMSARATLPNPDGWLKPGMLLQVEVLTDQREAPTVPEAAVRVRGDAQWVFVATDGVAVKRAVQIGRRTGDQVEIRAGVSAGDMVVMHGADKLGDGQALTVIGTYDGSVPVAELIRRTAP